MGRVKKDKFEASIDYTGKVVGDEIIKATSTKKTRSKADAQEKEEREREGRTQGRSGCKSKRINFAFWTETYDYVQTMARANGMTLAKFVNAKLLEAMEQDEKYQRIKEVLEE